MKLIFVRHGDPDYEKDALTEKGKKEAKLLSYRVAAWKNVTEFFQSPLGRAKETAAFSLEPLNRKAITKDWLMEFYFTVKDPVTGEDRIAWDLLPSYWTKHKCFYDKDGWTSSEVLKTGPIEENFRKVSKGIDELLLKYGYEHLDGYFKTKHDYVTSIMGQNTLSGHSTENLQLKDDGMTLVFFCHLGVSFAIIAYLLGFSPVQLWQSMYVAPTSVTVLSSEERVPGEVQFRIERFGDVTHLYKKFDGNIIEPVSGMGLFTDPFQL